MDRSKEKVTVKQSRERVLFKTPIKPCQLFVIASLIGILFVFVSFYSSHGLTVEEYFFWDFRDTGMDFFHSIEYMNGNQPYSAWRVQYPPLANVLFGMAYHMIPLFVSKSWKRSYFVYTDQRGTKYDLRTFQAPMVLFILFVALSVLLLIAVAYLAVRNRRELIKFGVISSVLCSFPVLCALERGNIIVLSWVLTMAFLLGYNHEKALVRELSLISLALSAGLKFYPAIYGLILIREKRWGAAFRAVVYGMLSVILPTLFLGEGLSGLAILLDILLKNNSVQGAATGMSPMNTVVDNLIGWLSYYGIPVYYRFFSALLSLLLLWFFFTAKENWRSVLYLTALLILSFSQPEYCRIFFLSPLLLCIRENQPVEKTNIVAVLCMILLVVNVPIVSTSSVLRLFFYNGVLFCLVLSVLVQFVWRVVSLQKRDTGRSKRCSEV